MSVQNSLDPTQQCFCGVDLYSTYGIVMKRASTKINSLPCNLVVAFLENLNKRFVAESAIHEVSRFEVKCGNSHIKSNISQTPDLAIALIKLYAQCQQEGIETKDRIHI